MASLNSPTTQSQQTDLVDIHVHLIPAVDDGPASFEELLQMLRLAYDTGTRKMIATPHMFLDPYNNTDPVSINNRFAHIVAEIKRRSEAPECAFLKTMAFFLGSENYLSPEFLEALQDRCVLTLNGGRYLLVEFPPFLPRYRFDFILDRVLQAGFVPILAHPERYIAVQDDPRLAIRFLDVGCLLQVNGDSITGASGSHIQKTSLSLLAKGLVHVIATDGHRVNSRPPRFEGVFSKLKRIYPVEKVRAWMAENPSMILNNHPC